MGKKGKDKKKGKGAEKTATKTDKKLLAKQKKLLTKIGEADIEKLVAQYELEEKKQLETTETIVPPPTSRVNYSICSHPDKEEIIIFGGEFFDGQKTTIFNDFYFYNVPKNEWKLLKSPAGPTPRSGHQMVSIATDGGQLWLFGGEFASPSQLQFYHFRDLWVFRLNTKKWEKINAANGPSARSGHRMVAVKKRLIVFGGFHDNNQSYKYFNDVHLFSLETYTWQKIEPAGVIQPPPRSGCCMASASDGKILIWGGYSKSAVKKEIDRGVTHSDMYALTEDIKDKVPWKWTSVKPGGMRPLPRSGMSVAVAPNGKGYTFGGVLDVEEDEENLQGQFSNDIHSLDLVNRTWRIVDVTGKKEKTKKKKDGSADVDMDDEVTTEKVDAKTVSTDGVFSLVVGNSKATTSTGENKLKSMSNANTPCPRMNSGMTVCKGNLYIFGGIVEEGHKQFTLCDFYSLDLHKLDSWKTLIPNNMSTKDWLGSDSEDSSDEEDSDEDDDDDDDDDDEDDEDEDEMDTE